MNATDLRDNLEALGPNAVVYSEKAWAVARKSAARQDAWFPDPGAWSGRYYISSAEMVDWTDDWEVIRYA